MNLTGVFLLAAALQVSAATHAQTVTFSAKAMPLGQVLSAIGKQTGYNIFYDEDELKETLPVTVELHAASLEDALTKVLAGQPLDFEIQQNTVFVRKKATVSTGEAALAGAIDIHGRVTDSLGTPMAGASVTVKGTKKGVETDANGEFVLKGVDPAGAVLVVSFTGYGTQEVALKGRAGVVLVLRAEVSSMQDVVINKGYYTERQRLSVANVSRVTANEIEKQPVQNPLLALQGRVPGLTVTQNTGVPGGGVKVRIQGQNNISVTSGTDPLYVVDGVPYVSEMLSTFTGGPTGTILGNSNGPVGSGGGNPLSYLNPDDIESIEVLKDADATSIYGSRAANGAILITTKKGKVGQSGIDVNLQSGWGNVAQKLHVLNTQQYLAMRHEAFRNDNVTPTISNAPDLLVWDTTRFTDWQKSLIGNIARYSQISTGFSGGSPNMQYLIRGTYNKQTSVFPGDFNDQRGGLHFNINSNSFDKKFTVQLTGNYLIDINELPALDFTSLALFLAPDAPDLYNKDGSLNWAPNSTGTSSWGNPLSGTLRSYEDKVSNLIGNMVVGYKILPDLEIKASAGYNSLIANEYQAYPSACVPPENRPLVTRVAWYTNSNINSWIVEPQLNYKKITRFGKIDFLVGNTIQQRNSNGQNLQGNGYNSDQVMRDILSASSVQVNGTDFSVYKYSALYGRLNYNWHDKYIVNLSARRDGSSRFGADNQFHNFWGIGAGWIFTEEKSLKYNSIISYGKIKGSFGTTGNDQIGDYRFLNLYSTVAPGIGYQGTNGLQPTGLPNPYIQWEETRKLQGGAELGFLKDRIYIAADYVENRTGNHLLSYVLPVITGFPSIIENFPALIQNTEWEFALNTVNVRSRYFQWSTNFNITVPRNKVVDFPGYSSSSYKSGTLGVIPGQPLGILKDYHFLQVDPSSGVYLFADQNGKPTATPAPADATTLINTLPDFYGGFENKFQFKGIELDVLLQFARQLGKQLLFNNFPGIFTSTASGNQPVSVLNRWQNPGDIATVSRYTRTSGSAVANSYLFYLSGSDYYYGDASFFRLKNISLSWQLPAHVKQKIWAQNLQLFISAQNLLTLTRYKGLDPENASSTSLPPLRMITTGLKLAL